jgi:putative ABC transport system permease protein
MSSLRLILKEIAYRRAACVMAVVAVAMAVAALIASLAILQLHDRRTEEVLASLEKQVSSRMAELDDEMRKATLKMSFSLVILPEKQDLRDWYTEDYAAHYMPESYVDRLARANIVTVQHLLPTLQQRIQWPEQKGRTIILIGTRGEIPYLGQEAKVPLVQPVPEGKIVLGYQLQQTLSLNKGDKVRLLGREFVVHRCQPQRGTKDDISAWIPLGEAQHLLKREGVINAVLALHCMCAGKDLSRVRSDIRAVLPDTQVVEMGSTFLARYEARARVGQEAKAAVQRERDERARLRAQRERLASVLAPLLMAIAGLWLLVLAFREMRLRRQEYGILRAIGVGSRRIAGLLLAKAALVGLLGAAAGYFFGVLVGVAFDETTNAGGLSGAAFREMLHPSWVAMAVASAVAIAVLATWVPAVLAARTDPAVILQEG